MDTAIIVDCFAMHRGLVDEAHRISRGISHSASADSDLLRLAAGCVSLGARRAIAARDPRDAIGGWNECRLGDRQIRLATYRVLLQGLIDTRQYDRVLAAAISATRAREDELLRLRRHLLRAALV
jgi:hypothetical protein